MSILSKISVTLGLFFLVLIDRITKTLALSYLIVPYKVNSFLSYDLVINRGISWGIGNSASSLIFGGITLLTIVVTLALAVYTYRRIQQDYSVYGELLVLAGSCSNIFDRLVYNGVIDFILVHAYGFYFPYFNIADAAIVVGVAIMCIVLASNSR